MRRFLNTLTALLAVFVLVFEAQAHHPAHHSGATGAGSFNTLALNASSTFRFLGLGYDLSVLDSNLGYLSQLALTGEYGFNKNIAVGARLPMVMVRDRALPAANEIGDISVNGRYLFFPTDKLTLSSFLEISFPVGDEEKGTGHGAFIFSPGVVVHYAFEKISLFGSIGVSTKVTDGDQVLLTPLAGIKIPLVTQGLTVSLLTSVESQIHLSSSSFDSGSAKVYLRPALQFGFGPKWWVTASGKISVADTLSAKKGRFAPTSTTLLSDVEAGFGIDINRIF